MNYTVQYFDKGDNAPAANTHISVAVNATDALDAIQKAARRLEGLPEKKGFSVYAVGPTMDLVVDNPRET